MNNQNDPSLENEIHLRDYYRVIKKRKSLVLTFALITIAVVLLVTLATTPLYEASVGVLIERNYDNELAGQGFMPYDPEFYGTQFNIIQSKNVVNRVVKKLKLDTAYRYYFIEAEQTSLLQPLKTWFEETLLALLPAQHEYEGAEGFGTLDADFKKELLLSSPKSYP